MHLTPGHVHCYGCQAEVPDISGPTHDYLGATPGCWALYGAVLAREYSDPELMVTHQLTVDAWYCRVGKTFRIYEERTVKRAAVPAKQELAFLFRVAHSR